MNTANHFVLQNIDVVEYLNQHCLDVILRFFAEVLSICRNMLKIALLIIHCRAVTIKSIHPDQGVVVHT